MFQFVVEGPQPNQRWKGMLEEGRSYVLGRASDCDVLIPWEAALSRKHLRLTRTDDSLRIENLVPQGNSIFFEGEEVRECLLSPNRHCAIGETVLKWQEVSASVRSSDHLPADEVTFSHEALKRALYPDPDRRIDVLSHLPELIGGSRTEQELALRLVNLLLAGIPQAEAAALIAFRDGEVEILHWDRRKETAGALKPSSRLVREAVQAGQSVLHLWHRAATASSMEYTTTAEVDWAFCTPVPGSETSGWGLYIAGGSQSSWGTGQTLTHQVALQSEVKFAELVAEIVGSVRRLGHLERQQTTLRQFFPPTVLAAVGSDLNLDLLNPRESDVTILFCDLRGFSKRAEEFREDLIGLLDRVSRALGVVTQNILAQGGGIGDFLGDAALGFWGWPVASESAPLDACRAALGIRQAFQERLRDSQDPLSDFRVGIGIAHGRAVAGKIGTSDHVKVTVFGPVVNLASRLESMTKQLHVPILLDEATAQKVRADLSPEVGRVRSIARVLPAGLTTPLTVSELLPPAGPHSPLTDEHLENFERAVEAFIAGRWEEAHRALHTIPPTDQGQDFMALQIAQHARRPPADWNGVIPLPSK